MLQIIYDVCHETLKRFHLQAHKTHCNLNRSPAKEGSGRRLLCYGMSPWHSLMEVFLVAFAKAFYFILFSLEKEAIYNV